MSIQHDNAGGRMVHQLAFWIQSHGFKVRVQKNNTINIYIPFTSPCGNGTEVVNVSNLTEAKRALGY